MEARVVDAQPLLFQKVVEKHVSSSGVDQSPAQDSRPVDFDFFRVGLSNESTIPIQNKPTVLLVVLGDAVLEVEELEVHAHYLTQGLPLDLKSLDQLELDRRQENQGVNGRAQDQQRLGRVPAHFDDFQDLPVLAVPGVHFFVAHFLY